jgi:hypothetical protein
MAERKLTETKCQLHLVSDGKEQQSLQRVKEAAEYRHHHLGSRKGDPDGEMATVP